MAIGDPIIAYDTLESTNKTAAELLRLSKVQHGAVILAHEQTSGRGQRGRTWISSAGQDLTVSVVLKPGHLRAEEQFMLGRIAALAVADVVANRVADHVRIKWPNDVLVGRSKIAGILIKNEMIGELVLSSILGIGINANSTDLPEDLVATSLRLETGHAVDLQTLLAELCAALDRRYGQWERKDPALGTEYTEKLWARGRWTEVLLDDQQALVRPMDVDPYGRLIVEHEGGEVGVYGLDRLRFAPR